MDNKELFRFFLLQTNSICIEFCMDFELEAVEYDGLLVFYYHVEYLDTLKEKLGLKN
jgi:hypothetical protein